MTEIEIEPHVQHAKDVWARIQAGREEQAGE